MGIDRQVTRRAVFLDRDGVLNKAVVRNGRPFPPAMVTDVEVLPGVADQLTRLKALGFYLIGVTNQPDVARQVTSIQTVEEINRLLMSKLPLDEISVCFHDDGDHCSCRKPSPGLILDAARRYQIDVGSSYMVGDRWKDIEAGKRAGCTTLLVDYAYSETFRAEAPDWVGTSVADALNWIISRG